MRIRFLGTGTSQGIPIIGCHCSACKSKDPKDQRFRTSVLIQRDSTTILIDSGPDVRMQLLRAEVKQLHAVLLTHEHNDHVIGLDDLRPLIFRSEAREMTLYGMTRVLDQVKSRFAYAFAEVPYPGAPKFNLKPIDFFETYSIGKIDFTPFPVMHGGLKIAGYRFKDFCYITDCKYLNKECISLIKDCEVLVLNALRINEHPTHLNFDESLKLIQEISPKKAYLTHLSHDYGAIANFQGLPEHVQFAYDGLEIVV